LAALAVAEFVGPSAIAGAAGSAHATLAAARIILRRMSMRTPARILALRIAEAFHHQS
jgi:hypothetical protein